MKYIRCLALFGLTLALFLSGCARSGVLLDEESIYIDQVVLEEVLIEDEAVALSGSPVAINDLLLPVAPGAAVKQNKNVTIDYSNIADGYVMVQYGVADEKKMKVQVTGPSTTYTYDLPVFEWVTFPLSDGNGEYTVRVYELNPATGKYAVMVTAGFTVTLTDEFAPFIRPNQYVNFANAEKTVKKAQELTEDADDALKKVEEIYNYVVKTMSYDTAKAESVKSGYLPVLDDVLDAEKGICFDYAALMAGMLRSQGVPCKLVVGYAGTAYHAWISVWTEEAGWLDGVIYFDGSSWQRMDPTFASSNQGSEAILKYIGDGNNYTVKYLY